MRAKLLSLGLLVIGLSVAGCGQPADDKKPNTTPKKDDDHDHGEGPHGGTVIELGKYHGEFCMDHGKKQATVYILNEELTKNEPITATKLLLSITAPKFQVELVASPQEGDPAGKASRFVATHDNFGTEQEFAGTLSGEINGKPYAGDFKEEPHKDEKK